MGIIVDKVSEVLDIAGEEIEDAPSFGVSVDTDFILGMGKANGKVTILLDISKVLTGTDVQASWQHRRTGSRGQLRSRQDEKDTQPAVHGRGRERTRTMFKNLTVGKKISLGFAGALILLAVVAVVGFYALGGAVRRFLAVPGITPATTTWPPGCRAT